MGKLIKRQTDRPKTMSLKPGLQGHIKNVLTYILVYKTKDWQQTISYM